MLGQIQLKDNLKLGDWLNEQTKYSDKGYQCDSIDSINVDCFVYTTLIRKLSVYGFTGSACSRSSRTISDVPQVKVSETFLC